MNVGVVTFPGSNCDADARYAATQANAISKSSGTVYQVWHKDAALPPALDLVILPGGFSYGDYLRTGAIARFSPIMNAVVEFAKKGGYVLGICNGFQILCETGLLPGALIRNSNLQFVCKDVYLTIEQHESIFTHAASARQSPLRIPIAHGEGRYTASAAELDALEDSGCILFKYADANGCVTMEANPNGSERNIAGILNKQGNVMGMMPHPERAIEQRLGSADGMEIFTSIGASVRTRTSTETQVTY